MKLISKDSMMLNTDFETQTDVFNAIAKIAENLDIIDDRSDLIRHLKAREKLGSTGMMDGFAIPHAKSVSIKIPAVVIIKNNKAIRWESMDNKDINFIIALLVPEKNKSDVHLEILKKISIKLMDAEIRSSLQKSESKEEILDILELE